MKKSEIKNILISMRTIDNESAINNLLGKIDLLAESKLDAMIKQIGDNEESIRSYLQQKLTKGQEHEHSEHTPINKMFSYGTSGSCIHLHMPVDLHQFMSEIGISKTIDMVNLYLLDAIERIGKMQKEGFYRFVGKDSIYMISPILFGREIKFLNGLDFKTNTYKKKELQDEQFVAHHPEAQLALHVFGMDKNVGTAKISLETISSKEWQEKRLRQIELFKEKGIILEDKVGNRLK